MSHITSSPQEFGKLCFESSHYVKYLYLYIDDIDEEYEYPRQHRLNSESPLVHQRSFSLAQAASIFDIAFKIKMSPLVLALEKVLARALQL